MLARFARSLDTSLRTTLTSVTALFFFFSIFCHFKVPCPSSIACTFLLFVSSVQTTIHGGWSLSRMSSFSILNSPSGSSLSPTTSASYLLLAVKTVSYEKRTTETRSEVTINKHSSFRSSPLFSFSFYLHFVNLPLAELRVEIPHGVF